MSDIKNTPLNERIEITREWVATDPVFNHYAAEVFAKAPKDRWAPFMPILERIRAEVEGLQQPGGYRDASGLYAGWHFKFDDLFLCFGIYAAFEVSPDKLDHATWLVRLHATHMPPFHWAKQTKDVIHAVKQLHAGNPQNVIHWPFSR